MRLGLSMVVVGGLIVASGCFDAKPVGGSGQAPTPVVVPEPVADPHLAPMPREATGEHRSVGTVPEGPPAPQPELAPPPRAK